jgi:hypothetical protein
MMPVCAWHHSARNYYLLRLSMVGSSIEVSASTDWGATFLRLGGGIDSGYASGRIGVRHWGSRATFDRVEVLAR